MVSLRGTDGQLIWSVPVPESRFGSLLALVLASNNILLAVTLKRVVALNASSADGAQLWTVDAPSPDLFWGSAAFDAHGSLLVPTNAGTYSVYTPCAAGHACLTPTLQLPCPPGTYSPGDATSCTLCPANTFGPANLATRASECLPCPEGSRSPPGSATCARDVQALGPPPSQSLCSMRLFPSHDVTGQKLAALTVAAVDDCHAACCANSTCLGFSFLSLRTALPSCTLLFNVSHVVPSSIMSGGVRNSVLGL